MRIGKKYKDYKKEENVDYVLEQLHIISDKPIDYSTYYNKKYYKAGFKDGFSTIIKDII